MDGEDGITITFMAKREERDGDSCHKLDAFGAAVTVWEQFREVERL